MEKPNLSATSIVIFGLFSRDYSPAGNAMYDAWVGEWSVVNRVQAMIGMGSKGAGLKSNKGL